jgi:ubiquitin-protein ligase
VFHPNVDAQSGSICLDILTADKWSAVLDVSCSHALQRSCLTRAADQGAAGFLAIAAFRTQQRVAFKQSSRFTVMPAPLTGARFGTSHTWCTQVG